jgi:acetylornithine deacetylase/succinyl-diaminopimelate desuccinylase-like protein
VSREGFGVVSSEPDLRTAAAAIGDDEALRLLAQLVATAPTNLEDPVHSQWEKPNYLRTADAIVRAARASGLRTTVYDPLVAGDVPGDWHGLNRPNVVVDLDVGAPETVLILAHFDVVPVPAEQWPRWKSPPHTLSQRPDGRLYGRGAADDLGSGVVASLLAMRRLANGPTPSPRNVRLLACCDEETGGEGGIEALKEHDGPRAPSDPERVVRGDVALIPDGAPETTAGSSGVAFLDASFARPVPLVDALAYGTALVGLHEVARTWKSVYASPDWPDRHAPEPVITGRATVTRFDLAGVVADPAHIRLLAAHSENDAANQIARAVTWVVGGPAAEVETLRTRLAALVPEPYRLAPAGPTSLAVPAGATALQLVGESAHGGYPHRGRNPVPMTFQLLKAAIDRGWLDGRAEGTATFSIDLRLIPEMELEDGLGAALSYVRTWSATHSPSARIEAPPARCRPGYALPVDHPALVKMERILHETLGAEGTFGEYGGTDASSLRDLRTPSGAPLPAIVFGCIDVASHMHEAEESVDPKMIGAVAATIERFVREP